jgi:hypothetical protein
MNTKAVVWTCAAILLVPALAGTALSASYEGIVTGNDVYVRSGRNIRKSGVIETGTGPIVAATLSNG